MPFSAPALLRALTVAGYRLGERVEFCSIGQRGAIASLWVGVDTEGLERAGKWLEGWRGRRNLYMLANPIKPGVKRYRSRRATEEHCATRECLLIDVDPVKDKATDPQGTAPEKLAAAAEIADEIRAYLHRRLEVLAPLVSSGRGRQIWLRISGDHTTRTRQQLVRGLARLFDRPGFATVDRSTHNVARLVRLPGSINLRTGTPAHIVDEGDGERADAEEVRALAEELTPAPKMRSRAPDTRDTNAEEVVAALAHVSADDYGQWVNIGFALAASGLADAFGIWDRWSASGKGYGGTDANADKWRSFDAAGTTRLGTLFHHAERGGWIRPARVVENPHLLPLLEVHAPGREVTADPEPIVQSVIRALKGTAPVVQDRRPAGSGKTTRAAEALVAAVEEGEGKYIWASPSHELAREEVLPAFAKAGAVIWDEDLGDVRERLAVSGARIVPVGDKPPHSVTVGKVPPFECPGPKVKGWTSESVAQLYQDSASRGWNPAATVCRACPLFLEGCAYWDRRREVAKADVLVVPHHALRGGAKGRRALVIDEDPAGALIRKLEVTGAHAFGVLLDAAVEHVGAEVQTAQEKIDARAALVMPTPEQVTAAHKARERMPELLDTAQRIIDKADAAKAALAWLSACAWDAEVREFTRPDVSIGDLSELGKACERVLRKRKGEPLTDADGKRVGAVRNLLPLLVEAERLWQTGPVVLHRPGVLPVVQPLPDVPTLALDATGDPRLLALATGREVRTIEGALTGKLWGVHLADFPCGRRRYRRPGGEKRDGTSAGRSRAETIAADVAVIARYARRKGVNKIGLVTFKFTKSDFVRALEADGFEVRALHYGGEVGSNAFGQWADLVVLAGTPFVPPGEVRLRAGLEGAGAAELLTEAKWEARRLPGGGTASVLVLPGEASTRAYAALVRSRLEQSLGRAMRWDWTPPHGVLVLAEPWPTRHSLRITTRRREALEGDEALMFDAIGGHVDERARDPICQLQDAVRGAIAEAGGVEALALTLGVTARAVRYWVAGECLPAMSLAARFMSIDMGLVDISGRVEYTSPSGHSDSTWCQFSEVPPKKKMLKVMGSLPQIDMSVDNSEVDMEIVDNSGGGDMESDLVERAIKAAGGTVKALADVAEFSPTTVRRWRNGSLKPGKRSVQRLEAYLAEHADVSPPEPDPGKNGGAGSEPLAPENASASAPATIEVPRAPTGASPGTGHTAALSALRDWLDPSTHHGYLLRAAGKARGLGSLATWMGSRKQDGVMVVDPNLALTRTLVQIEDLSAPLPVRQLWGELARLLAKRGAKVEEPKRSRKARKRGKK